MCNCRKINENKTDNCFRCKYYKENGADMEDDLVYVYSKCNKYDDEWYDIFELKYYDTVEVEEEAKDSFLDKYTNVCN